jgi:hypothetical protein|nr:MAG TPA: hypothetical protein [Caudoviricetes sp.]
MILSAKDVTTILIAFCGGIVTISNISITAYIWFYKPTSAN